ncbi:MAG: hypothetical protein ACMUHU_05805 [Thermoplasmatota archaeon]
MYCIVKCPFCKNLQGGRYPVKVTKCKVCSKRIDLEKTGLIGTYEELKEMQGNLMAMKWKGEDEDDLVDVIAKSEPTAEAKKTSKGRDGIRRAILEKLETDHPRDLLVKELASEGNDIELVEIVLEELIENGLVHYPRYALLRKVGTVKR